MNLVWLLRRTAPFALVALASCIATVTSVHLRLDAVTAPVATLAVGAIASTIALTAVFLSWRTIRAGRHNAKATVTFQHIAKVQSDGDMIRARGLVRTAIRAGNIAQYAAAENEADPTTLALILLLNDFEIVAIGIKRGIIDCSLYRAWGESSVIDYWRKAEPFISTLRDRTSNPKLYLQFQEMKTAWDTAHPHYKHNPNSPYCT